MRTSETLLLDFIRQSPQFRIPVNQRRYAWTRRHCRQLWDDILDAGERGDVREHFLGPVMYVAAVDPLNADWAPCLVYDGQQRLTTITLILKALAGHLKEDAAPEGFEPEQIRTEYLVNPIGKGEQHYRLVLKPGDAATLPALVHDRPMPAEPSSRILDAFAFFEKRIRQLGPDVSVLCAGLRKLRIVAFHLKEGEDNPQRIFETMNACGRDLTFADMIGNFILMPLDRERQERLYVDHLRPIDRGFERHGEEHFDAFLQHYLTLRTGEVPKQGEEYAAFRTHARSRRLSGDPQPDLAPGYPSGTGNRVRRSLAAGRGHERGPAGGGLIQRDGTGRGRELVHHPERRVPAGRRADRDRVPGSDGIVRRAALPANDADVAAGDGVMVSNCIEPDRPPPLSAASRSRSWWGVLRASIPCHGGFGPALDMRSITAFRPRPSRRAMSRSDSPARSAAAIRASCSVRRLR